MSIFTIAMQYFESIIKFMEFVTINDEVQDEAAILELIANDLRPFYEPRLPYHNWDEHIASGMAVINQICSEAQSKGRKVNTFMAQVAYLGHDAGYAHDLLNSDVWQEYGSKEAYSAHIMASVLRNYDMEEDFISGVQTCIMFTKMDEKLDHSMDEELANTAKAVRMTDLYNVFGSYKGFIINSFKLMEEDRVYGRERNLAEFKDVTKFVLTSFLDVDFLPVASCKAVDGMNNIERFMKDTPSRLISLLGTYANRFANLINSKAA